jgi:hypothetical protein
MTDSVKENMFNIFYNIICDYTKEVYNIGKLIIKSDYFVFAPLIYSTFFVKNIFIKVGFGIAYSYYLYKYRAFYLETIIDDILIIKIKLFNIIYKKYFFKKKDDFILQKVLLYSNLKDNIDVTKYFKTNVYNKISRSTIKELYDHKNIPLEYNPDIRLKIFFSYKNNNYIIYFPYSKNINKDFEEYYIPYPPYSEKIIADYRNDIILPYHTEFVKKKILYSLFSIESKNIGSIKINNLDDNNLVNYFEMVKTPFNDYGILYNVPIKLIWALYENNIDLENINTFELTFLNPYFDQDSMDLKVHNIQLFGSQLNDLIISDHMKDILDKKIII